MLYGMHVKSHFDEVCDRHFFYLTEFIREVAQKTGIILDPVYTGKAVRGMLEELAKNPTRFRGRHILFLHTGEIHSAI